jgi:hypothetical protein
MHTTLRSIKGLVFRIIHRFSYFLLRIWNSLETSRTYYIDQSFSALVSVFPGEPKWVAKGTKFSFLLSSISIESYYLVLFRTDVQMSYSGDHWRVLSPAILIRVFVTYNNPLGYIYIPEHFSFLIFVTYIFLSDWGTMLWLQSCEICRSVVW